MSLDSAPISERVAKGTGTVFLRIFGAIFFLVGAAVSYFLVLQPAWRIAGARNWNAAPCHIISSRVVSHSGDDGPTYSVEVSYSYIVDGRELQSNRYSFFKGSSSGYKGKQAVVDKFPPNTNTICFVNPKDPSDAVLNRNVSGEMWFGLIPLVFLVTGGCIFVFAPRMAGRRSGTGLPLDSSHRTLIPDSSMGLMEAGLPEYPQELKPSGSPVGKLIGIIVVALFWCGIVSVFIFHVIAGWREGHTEWFLAIFLIPFVLVGAGLLAAIPYQFLALFNPRISLKVNSKAVPLGGELRLEWNLSGQTRKVRRLRLSLEGREEATYQRGSSSSTDKNVFISLPLLDSTDPNAIAAGSARLAIPSGLMHTFIGANNKVLWSLHARGEIPRWPNIDEEFAITVLPLKDRS